MKNRFFFLLFLVTGVAWFICFRLFKKTASSEDYHDRQKQVWTVKANSAEPDKLTAKKTGKPPATPVGSGKSFKQMPLIQQKEYLNHVPIAFYGFIEDQYSNRLTRTAINFSVQFDTGFNSGIKNGRVITDDRGYFEIKGYKGESLSVVPEKEGYILWTTTNAGGIYSSFWPAEKRIKPDPEKPVVIRMWKLQGAESLVHSNIETYVPVDGIPIRFDLESGKRVDSGGDLIIRIDSPLNPDVLQRYGWKVAILPVEGGIMPLSDRSYDTTFCAPETGYHREFNIGYTKESKPWSSSYNGCFVLKSRGGKNHGKIGVLIYTTVIRNNAIYVNLGGYLNPAGSRNLEIDPKLVTEVKTKGEAD